MLWFSRSVFLEPEGPIVVKSTPDAAASKVVQQRVPDGTQMGLRLRGGVASCCCLVCAGLGQSWEWGALLGQAA